jgi:hypothetical protein
MSPNSLKHSARNWIVGAALFTGVAVGAAGVAGAVSSATSSNSANPTTIASSTQAAPSNQYGTPPAQNGQAPGGQDPATMSHGPGETLLTGTTAAKVKAAALAANPGATVIRVETDSAGSAYEAHLRKSDGTEITVKFDSSFNATATQNGFGPGPSK